MKDIKEDSELKYANTAADRLADHKAIEKKQHVFNNCSFHLIHLIKGEQNNREISKTKQMTSCACIMQQTNKCMFQDGV